MPDSPTPLDLDAIKAAIAACRTYNFGMHQADRLAHEHAPALVEEVKRLRADVALLRPALAQWEEAFEEESDAHDALKAEVARLTARPAPAWDEEVVVEAVATALHGDGCPEDPDEGESCACSDYLREARIALAVVRDYLPVKHSRETVAWAILDALDGCIDYETQYLLADAVLDLFSGRSEAEVKAEALRDFAARVRDEMGYSDKVLGTKWATDEYRHGMRSALMQVDEEADHLAAEGGADRG